MFGSVRNVVLLGSLYGEGTPAGSYLGSEASGLAIDFAQNSALVRGHTTNFSGTPQNLLTVTRASSATYFDSAGVMQTAANNILRLDHNPSTLAALGVLVEEQRTNLVRQSQTLNTTWNKVRSTIASDVVVAPDGTTTADSLVEDSTAAATHGIDQTVTTSISTAYTLTVYAKANTRDWLYINALNNGVADNRTFFNVANGTVGVTDSDVTASIQSVGNGWYRCRCMITTTGIQTSIIFNIGLASADNTHSYSGDGASGIYLWGAQLE